MFWPGESNPKTSRRPNRFRGLASALARGWREKGPVYFFVAAVARFVPPRVFDCAVLRVMALDLSVEVPPDVDFYGVRWAGPDEIDLLSSLGTPRELVLSRFNQGHEVVIREQKGNLVSHSWYNTSCMELDLFRIHLCPEDVYGYDAFTARELRGRHLHRPVGWYARQSLGRRGYRRMVVAARSTNRDSVRMGLRGGHRVIGRIIYLSVLGVTIARVGNRWACGVVTRRHKIEIPIDATQTESGVARTNRRHGVTDTPGKWGDP